MSSIGTVKAIGLERLGEMMAYTDGQKANALDAVRRGKVDDFHPHDPERMDTFADVEICAASDSEFACELSQAKLIGSRALLGRVHEISESLLRGDDKKTRIGALMMIAKQWNPIEFGDRKAADEQRESIHRLVHVPFNQLSEDQKRKVEAFFGLGTDD